LLAVLLNLYNIFCGKGRENLLPEDKVGFQTFGHIITCISDIQCEEGESCEPWPYLVPTLKAPHLPSATTFTFNLFEWLRVKQDVTGKKESPNSTPKDESAIVMSTIHLLNTLKVKNVCKIKSSMLRT